MAFPAEVLADIARGKQYLSNLNQERISELKRGCVDCMPKGYDCLKTTIRAIDYKIQLDEYDAIAIANINIMKKVIGEYQLRIPPTVDAGNNQVVEEGVPAQFTATVQPGSSPIVSYKWTQISGNPVVLLGGDTPILTATSNETGVAMFRIEVTDENGLKASDTVSLTTSNSTETTGYVLSNDTGLPPSLNQILAGTLFVFNMGTDITVPFNSTQIAYQIVAIPVSEAIKNYYQDLINPLDKGDIGTGQDLFSAPILVGGFNVYMTVYPIPQPTPKRFQTI